MRLPCIFLLLCAALIVHVESEVVLYAPKDDMNAQDYIDRADYLSAIATPGNDKSAYFTIINATEAGPFKLCLWFGLPEESQHIHHLSLSAIMKTNIINPYTGRDAIWVTIELTYNGQSHGGVMYCYEASIFFLETYWLKTDSTSQLKFTSVINFVLNSTEYNAKIIYVEVQCPVSFTRPTTVEGSYDKIQVTHLISNSVRKVEIDLSISATLLPCVDNNPFDVTNCTTKSC